MEDSKAKFQMQPVRDYLKVFLRAAQQSNKTEQDKFGTVFIIYL